MSGLVDGRPGRRAWEPSYFWATSLRYQRRIVSGVTIPDTSARRRLPRTTPFTARRRRWSSVRRTRRDACAARRIRFSSSGSSMTACYSRLTQSETSSNRKVSGREGESTAEASRNGATRFKVRRLISDGQINLPDLLVRPSIRTVRGSRSALSPAVILSRTTIIPASASTESDQLFVKVDQEAVPAARRDRGRARMAQRRGALAAVFPSLSCQDRRPSSPSRAGSPIHRVQKCRPRECWRPGRSAGR